MAKNKKETVKEETVKLEKLNDIKVNNTVSDSFYYILGIVISFVLIFATQEFLSTINYLFVVIFVVIAVVQIIDFIMDKEYKQRNYSGMIICIMCIWMAMFIFKDSTYS